MILRTLQQNWKVPANNAQIIVKASPSQVQLVYRLYQEHTKQFNRFVQTIDYFQHPSQQLTIINQIHQIKPMLQHLIQQQWCLIEIINEQYTTYKGYISWILLASSHCKYLVDAGQLHDHLSQLKLLLENESVLKMLMHSYHQLQALKRDWQIFPVNIFDLAVMTWYGYATPPRLYLGTTIRPIQSKLSQTITKQFQTMWNLVEYLLQYLQRNQEFIKQAYYNFNSPDYLLADYQHVQLTTFTSEERQQVSQQQELVMDSLLNWRQHTARILDISTQMLIPYHSLKEITIRKARTIIQISELLTQHKISMDHYGKILEAIHCAQELFQDHYQLPRKNKSGFDDRNMRNLLEQIGWNDKDWLNRKNDQSIKLYKEIISIDEFDDSLVEDYIQNVSDKVIKKYQIQRYIKYAQYLRNGNQTRLKDYHNLKMSQMQFQHNIGQDWFTDKSSDEDQMSIKSSGKDNLQNYYETQILIRQDAFDQLEGSSNRKESGSIISIEESKEFVVVDNIKAIKPLPENIEQIYLMAAGIKKNHEKGQKTKKKQQKKTDTKLDEFVPTLQELIHLINI